MRALDSGIVKILGREYLLFGHHEDTQFQEFKKNGSWAEFTLSYLAELIRPDAVCLDIGAHVGIMAIAMASIATRGRVYAFEGSPETANALKTSVARNKIRNVDAFSMVLGRADEAVKFFDIAEVSTSSFSVPVTSERNVATVRPESAEVRVLQARSVDSLVAELGIQRVDLIKIDVEGAELEVLEGARATLAKYRPIVILEFNSYTYVQVREIVPRHALRKIFTIFDEIYYFKNRTGALVRLDRTEAATEKFLHENLFGGFVDDLLCCFSGATLIDGRPLTEIGAKLRAATNVSL